MRRLPRPVSFSSVENGLLTGREDVTVGVAHDVVPGDAGPARVRVHQRRQDPDQCRLARSVRAQHPADRARRDGEVQSAQRLRRAEAFAQPFGHDDRLVHHHSNWVHRTR